MRRHNQHVCSEETSPSSYLLVVDPLQLDVTGNRSVASSGTGDERRAHKTKVAFGGMWPGKPLYISQDMLARSMLPSSSSKVHLLIPVAVSIIAGAISQFNVD